MPGSKNGSKSLPKSSEPTPGIVRLYVTPNLEEQMHELIESFRNDLRSFLGPWVEFGTREHGGPWPQPRTDVLDTGSAYEVRAALPGITKEHIEVTLRGRTLRIEAKEAHERDQKGAASHTWESRSSGFTRVLELPEDVLADKITAVYLDGLLTIEVPKSHPTPERKIPVG